MNILKGKKIIDYKKKVNSGIESKPIIFNKIDYTFKDSITQLNPEIKDNIIPKNINNINKLCNQLLYSNKNINLTNKTETPLFSSNHKH